MPKQTANVPPTHIMHGRVVYLLAIIALIQTLYPITENAPNIVLIGFQLLYFVQIIAGILIVRDSPGTVWLLVALGVLWVMAGVAFALDQSNPLAQLGAYLAIAIYQAMVVWVLLRFIFTTRRVNLDVIYAACAVYLLIGAVFVGVFGALDILTVQASGAHAFRDTLVAENAFLPWQNLIYYSYTTLTTVGYGDVLPVTMWARSLAAMEMLIGTLYLTVIVARLVGLYATREVEQAEEAARGR